jgi:hypothetical protein
MDAPTNNPYSAGWWLVLICFKTKILLASWWLVSGANLV